VVVEGLFLETVTVLVLPLVEMGPMVILQFMSIHKPNREMTNGW
jgi:hypothetical protein